MTTPEDLEDDPREIYKFMKDMNRTRRTRNTENANTLIAEVEQLADRNEVLNQIHTWNMRFLGHRLMYYPPSGKWQYRGKMLHGGIHSFIQWMRKQRGLRT